MIIIGAAADDDNDVAGSGFVLVCALFIFNGDGAGFNQIFTKIYFQV